MKAWFVSDIHISGPEDARLAKFEEFLQARFNDETTHVFLVGDIFDLWVGGDEFFLRRYHRVVELILQLRAKSVEVIYFEGNHDLHLGRTWAERLGARVFTGPHYFDLGPHRVRVEHGDQMNPHDTGYLLLRAALRTPAVEWLAAHLPGQVIQNLGNGMSRSSRKWTSSSIKARNETAIRAMIHTHAEKVFNEDEPFDFIISGHVHVHDDFEWKDQTSDRTARSINLGWWSSSETSPKAFRLDATGGAWVAL